MQQIQWLPQDAVGLRDFLSTDTGTKFLAFLKSNVKIETADSIEKEVLNWRTYKGGMIILATIDLLSQDPPVNPPENVVQFHNTADTSESGRSSTKG